MLDVGQGEEELLFTLLLLLWATQILLCVYVCFKAAYFHIFMEWIYQNFHYSDSLDKIK